MMVPPEANSPVVRAVTDRDVGRVYAYLEGHLDTSVFLLSCLSMFGPAMVADGRSGNYRLLEDDAGIRAVWSLTRRGHLLAQTGGRADLAEVILDACVIDSIPITGVVAEWRIADAVWRVLTGRAGFRERYTARSTVYGMALDTAPAPVDASVDIRLLESSDFEQWDPVNSEFATEEGAPIPASVAYRQRDFEARTRLRHWWGGFVESSLVTMAAIDHDYAKTAQIGGIFTRRDQRGRGFARAIVSHALNDLRNRGLTRAVLFGYERAAAQRLYEAVGFRATGQFGLLFGKWDESAPSSPTSTDAGR